MCVLQFYSSSRVIKRDIKTWHPKPPPLPPDNPLYPLQSNPLSHYPHRWVSSRLRDGFLTVFLGLSDGFGFQVVICPSQSYRWSKLSSSSLFPSSNLDGWSHLPDVFSRDCLSPEFNVLRVDWRVCACCFFGGCSWTESSSSSSSWQSDSESGSQAPGVLMKDCFPPEFDMPRVARFVCASCFLGLEVKLSRMAFVVLAWSGVSLGLVPELECALLLLVWLAASSGSHVA